MICPVCKENGDKSIVYDYGGTTTLLAINSYYDEDGVYHHNDPNTTTTIYSCSKGHRFLTRSNNSFLETEILATPNQSKEKDDAQ